MEVPEEPVVIPPSPSISQHSQRLLQEQTSSRTLHRLFVEQPSERSSQRLMPLSTLRSSPESSLRSSSELLPVPSSELLPVPSSELLPSPSPSPSPTRSRRTTPKDWIDTEHESHVIKSKSDEIKEIKENTCYTENRELKNLKTCKISDKKIENISYFLSHKLPQCKELKINLNSISDGQIISRGAFGYSFLVKNEERKKIVKERVADSS